MWWWFQPVDNPNMYNVEGDQRCRPICNLWQPEICWKFALSVLFRNCVFWSKKLSSTKQNIQVLDILESLRYNKTVIALIWGEHQVVNAYLEIYKHITCLFTYGYLMQSAIYKNDIWFARYRHNSVRLYNIYNKDTLKANIDIINSITASPIGYWW